MFIIYGTRLYGRVDQVKGLCHVATRFVHIYFFPLIPIKSYIVQDTASTGVGQFLGKETSFSFKSVLAAWLRAGLFFPALAALVFGVIQAVMVANGDSSGTILGAVGGILGAGVLATLFALSWKLFRASSGRALELARELGLPESVARPVIEAQFSTPISGNLSDGGLVAAERAAA
jgi:hypothetical protein